MDIAFVGLNPTQEAIDNGAIYSRNRTFWNILEKSGLIRSTAHLHLNDIPKEVLLSSKYSDYRIGYTDVMPHIIETDSSKVNIEQDYVRKLIKTITDYKVKKIALLGQKVIDSFAKEITTIKTWKAMKAEGENRFGKIGFIKDDNQRIEVYGLPFPTRSSLIEKHLHYRKLI